MEQWLSTKILLGNLNNKFSTNKMILIPNVKGFGNVMDVIRVKDYLFIVRTGSGENFFWYKRCINTASFNQIYEDCINQKK